MPLIYIVEDDTNIREIESFALKNSGYNIADFESALEFNKALQNKIPDLILLDIMLPGEDGMAILKRLKSNERTKDIPVIMLTAKGAEYEKVMALDSGADDYVVKPFGMMELLSRIRAVLRRAKPQSSQEGHTYGAISLDKKKHEVMVDGKPVALTLKEFEMLAYLLENRNIVLTRDQLLEKIWGYDFDGETRTVDVHIRTLRQKLGKAGECIETVRGVGYRIGDKL